MTDDNLRIKIINQKQKEVIGLLEAIADSRLKLLRRTKGWLESYLDYLDTDIPLLGEPNNSLDNLIKELEKELGDD